MVDTAFHVGVGLISIRGLALLGGCNQSGLKILDLEAFSLKLLQVLEFLLLRFTESIKLRINRALHIGASDSFEQLWSPDNVLEHTPCLLFVLEVPLMPAHIASFNELEKHHGMSTFVKPACEGPEHAHWLQEGGNTKNDGSVESLEVVTSKERARNNHVNQGYSKSNPVIMVIISHLISILVVGLLIIVPDVLSDQFDSINKIGNGDVLSKPSIKDLVLLV